MKKIKFNNVTFNKNFNMVYFNHINQEGEKSNLWTLSPQKFDMLIDCGQVHIKFLFRELILNKNKDIKKIVKWICRIASAVHFTNALTLQGERLYSVNVVANYE